VGSWLCAAGFASYLCLLTTGCYPGRYISMILSCPCTSRQLYGINHISCVKMTLLDRLVLWIMQSGPRWFIMKLTGSLIALQVVLLKVWLGYADAYGYSSFWMIGGISWLCRSGWTCGITGWRVGNSNGPLLLGNALPIYPYSAPWWPPAIMSSSVLMLTVICHILQESFSVGVVQIICAGTSSRWREVERQP
jgi:hypothetical protein